MDAPRVRAGSLVAYRQSGATAIEFALVLPLLLALTYGLFVYGSVYVLYESINYAAQQGAESAVAVDPSIEQDGTGSYMSMVQTYAQNTVANVLSWLPPDQFNAAVGPGGSAVSVLPCSGTSYCPNSSTASDSIVVKITLPLAGLFPSVDLPGIGPVPPLPTSLIGVGVTLVSGASSS